MARGEWGRGCPSACPRRNSGYCTCAQDGRQYKAQKEMWLVSGLKDHGYLSRKKKEIQKALPALPRPPPFIRPPVLPVPPLLLSFTAWCDLQCLCPSWQGCGLRPSSAGLCGSLGVIERFSRPAGIFPCRSCAAIVVTYNHAWPYLGGGGGAPTHYRNGGCNGRRGRGQGSGLEWRTVHSRLFVSWTLSSQGLSEAQGQAMPAAGMAHDPGRPATPPARLASEAS